MTVSPDMTYEQNMSTSDALPQMTKSAAHQDDFKRILAHSLTAHLNPRSSFAPDNVDNYGLACGDGAVFESDPARWHC